MTPSPGTYRSQFGEDAILDRIFRGRTGGRCVEVGGNDGVTGSTTYHFEKAGWSCLLVEPVPEMARRIREARSCLLAECAASSAPGEATFFVAREAEAISSIHPTGRQEEEARRLGGGVEEIRVRLETLDAILEEHGMASPDFVTVDVEGHELEVLKGFSLERHAPRVVIVEDNTGGEDRSIPGHMASRGYVNFLRTGVNDWYARADDRELASPLRVALARARRGVTRAGTRAVARFGRYGRLLPAPLKRLVARIFGLN